MRIILSVLTVLMLFFTAQLSADVGEKELAGLRGAFMSRILAENPGKEGDIRRCLGSMVKEGSSGSRLIDRFGLFLYDSRRNRLVLEKIRFF
ncbi:MAG TPA: hypothetical protein PLT75_17660, partial [Spirochaetota bacterium]|nr:hypothetical protein [Spirochaetota bacterium]